MESEIAQQRFKEIREELKLTQAEFAAELGLKGTTADIERGRTRITGQAVAFLLQKFDINPLWLFGQSNKKTLKANTSSVLPTMVTVGEEERENILLVNQKAAAGYGKNIADPEFYQQLPAFGMPLPEFRNASFRGFQIAGDSMFPFVANGDWVLAKAVSNLNEIKSDGFYIVVEAESIRFKKIQKIDEKKYQLISLNPEFAPVSIQAKDIIEIWEYHSRISFGHDRIKGLTLETLRNEIRDLKREIKAIRA